MPLPTPNLDDLQFQKDIVDEARRRIVRYCPEWTDYNLSDPGITLIELFAWMTEMIVYRLNRVPDKNYIKFLELLGIQLRPASSARTELTFWLSTPFPIGEEDDSIAIVPKGTEVATRRLEDEEPITFTTDERLTIVPPILTQLRRGAEPDDFYRNYRSRLGIEDFYAFNREEPQVGDAFYLGFDETQDIAGHTLQLTFECEEAAGTGIKRRDPPWIWECSVGDDQWVELPLSEHVGERDTTGGLNNPEGKLVLYLPLSVQLDQVHGRTAYWVRCRIEPRHPDQGMYTQSPRIKNILAHTLGATTRATHAVIVQEELLGRSNGEPGQVFHLQRAPILALREAETLEVEEKHHDEIVFVPWQSVSDFSQSQPYDRHFVLDTATGEVRLGPSIRHRDGQVRQYGRIPEAGREIRFARYRHGGGVVGNVPSGSLNVLKSSIAYIDRVTNLIGAEGGQDQESLDEAKLRARQELRTQHRAVTVEDYETLSKGANQSVARTKCLAPGKGSGALPPGMVELLVVPAAFESLKRGDLAHLDLAPDLREEIAEHLEPYRLLTTTLRIREPKYLGIKVFAEILPAKYSHPETVRTRALQSLRAFLSPLNMVTGEQALQLGENERQVEIFGPAWHGWPFGKDLYLSEVYSLLQQVPGVKHVWQIQLWQREVIPGKEAAAQKSQKEESEQDELIQVQERRILVPIDTLLCSLDHEIQILEDVDE